MSIDPNKVKSGDTNSAATAFVTALVTNAALLTVEVGIFLILKTRLYRIYSPRTYLPPPDKRADKLPSGPWRWIPAVINSPLPDIIHKNGLDAYMFMRYLRMLMITFLIFTVITFPIIMPIDAVGINTGREGLDRITWSNLADSPEQTRFAAHVVTAYILTFIVIYMIRREMLHFVHMRHQFLLSKSHSRLPQARTVLVTAIPDELGNEHDLRTFASFTPGGVDRVWLYRDTKILNELFEARVDACNHLESATASLLRDATLAWRAKQKQHKKEQKLLRKKNDVEKDHHKIEELDMPPPTHELLDELVPRNKRPTHRTGLLGMVGKKVDTVEWCMEEISRLNNEIKDGREHIVKGKFLGSAFIRCNLQMGAHVLAQCVSYHEPLAMYDKWMEAHPKDIVWRNLDDGALEMRSRYVTSWMATIGLIIAWAFPVAFVGTLSNVGDLCAKVHWLAWICTSPKIVRGLIQGVLPPALLAALFALLPFILRGLAWYECIPRYSLMSVSVYKRFYFFLVIHGFLIVTLTSGITQAIEDILENPTQTVSNLAKELPGASIFFLTYMVTQGLAGAGMALIQLAPLVLHYIRKWFLGRTPRQAYNVTFIMPSADFGTILPRLSLLATIGFAYSVLSPLINLLAFCTYVMFYITWKFLFTQVFDQPDECETGGMYFPMAVSNLFVGLYVKQVCMACLFFLKIKIARIPSLIGGIFMILLALLTLSAQLFIRKSFDPISHYIPMSLATKKMAKRYEHNRKKRLGLAVEEDEEIDMFSRDRLRSVRRQIKSFPKALVSEALDTIKGRPSHDQTRTSHDGKSLKGKKKVEVFDVPPTNDETGAATGVESHRLDGAPDLFRQPSHASSKKSKKSDKSQKSKSTKHTASAEHLGSAPSKSSKDKLPHFAPAAAAAIADDSDSDSDEEDDDFDEHAFDHPSTYVEQAWIWVPKDALGLSAVLVEDYIAAGVHASHDGAKMNEKGEVDVDRNPPDEAWEGGHDR
ncbi:hypothetical protein HGRIS_012702 [Hohenbuehelia grisea]|uniref:DUF221-domain-containing protein n=1 Tax=Hohenbuehelia grisea TaxID=104357 RepID=A0ABR3ITD5_9AGAR